MVFRSKSLDIRVLSRDAKEIPFHDDEDEDDRAIRNKAESMGVDVGAFGDHEVKPPAPPEETPNEDIIAEEIDNEFSDEQIDANLKETERSLI